VAERVALLAEGNEIVFGQRDGFRPVGQGVGDGAFFSPTLLLCRDARSNAAVHDIEAFGPVSTMMTYEGMVAWDVQVTNQNDELVASYDILTLVQKREGT
jgi:acyl-CoA reductase-like NAD-dependent aldehyde dehydrogenase